MTNEHTEQIKHAADWIAAGTTIGAIIGWLPAIAALFTIIWTLIRIFETKTVQKMISRFRGNK